MKKIAGLKLSDLEKYSESYDLAEIIGMDHFEKVIELFSGQSIYIPEKKSVYREARDREVIREYEQGISIRSLANKYEVTTTWIMKIIASYKANKA